ncbi:MAG: hypothetical protein ACO3JJ_08455 [Opitutaceae bacterium]
MSCLPLPRPVRRLAGALALCGAMAPAAAPAGVLDWLFPRPELRVVTVTDTTPVGALRRPVSPAQPAYYVAVSAGFRDFGGIVAGEKAPAKEEVFRSMARVLARQGYLPASAEHPPSLLLLWTWGTMNTDRIYSANPDDTEGRQVNRNQLLRFMGAYKLGLVAREPGAGVFDPGLPGALFRDADQEVLSDLATEDLYVAAIAAYDHAAAVRSQKVLLWTTKISAPSRGHAFAEILPSMLALAGPQVGRETARPVVVTAGERFKAEVKIGDATVVEGGESPAVPVTEVTPPAGNTRPAPARKARGR